jgi:UDP-N-acetylglucosamine 4,6-dehydratase/5-epimerase
MSSEAQFTGRSVLVTGGTGSIGNAIVEAILRQDPRVVRVISRDDTKQFELAQRHRGDLRLRMLIGDVRNLDRMRRATAGIEVVFHAAAMKHVPSAEFNPFEATETNVRGTQNVVEAAIDAGVDKVLTISTDKAVDPSNVMGATKLLAERLMTAAQAYKGPAATRFASVRFGNVIGSRGSLVPLIWGQVARGGPVTVTDPEMTRYLMPVSQAVGLCFEAVERMQGGEVFILKMPRVRTGDLVEVLVEAYAPSFGFGADQIAVEVIGARPGEKRDEALLTKDEAAAAHELPDMYVLDPRHTPERSTAAGGRADEPLLDRGQLRDLLDAAGWLHPESLPTLG